MKERLIIIFVAIIAGLFITSAGFFIYQSTKKVNDTPLTKNIDANEPTPRDESKIFVQVAEPADETLTTKRSIIVKGATNPGNIIVVSSNLEDVQAQPDREGNFSITVDIDAGANPLTTRAFNSEGQTTQDIRTVTYSTEEF